MSEAPARKGRTGLIVGGVVGLLALLLGGAYVAGYLMAGDKTPANASVQGVPIGGMTPDEALTKLETELGPSFDEPITLEADGKKATVQPSKAGLRVDLPATVKQAGAGKSWNPAQIWNVLRGGTAVKPVTRVDKDELQKAVDAQAATFAVDAKDAGISFKDAKAVITPGTDEVRLDTGAAAEAIRKAWPEESTVAAPLVTKEPEITTAEVEAVKKDHADPLVSGPITVKAGQKSFPVTPKTLAAATTFTAKDGAITAKTDMEKVWKAAQASIDALGLDEPKDATVTMKDGKPTVVPSVDGVGIDKKDFIKVVEPVLLKSGDERKVEVKVTKKKANVTTEDAKKMGVKEVMGEYTTEFPYAEYRNVNLSQVAKRLNGHMVKAGEVFSMNATLGERTKANGYVDGSVIQGSRLVQETGGGVSQSATTLFNAIFFAGLEDVEHHPHTLYFSRYPAGREATLYYGKLDLKFRNNTPQPVVMQVIVNKAKPGSKGSITFKIWGTKQWDKVTSTKLAKSDFYDAPDETSDEENCQPQSASPGFTVNYSRQFHKGGKVVKTEPFRWRYSATPKVTCT